MNFTRMGRALVSGGAAVVITTAMIATGTVGAGAASSNKMTITAGEYTYKFWQAQAGERGD